jgi:hypothetical protein
MHSKGIINGMQQQRRPSSKHTCFFTKEEIVGATILQPQVNGNLVSVWQ